MLPRPIQAAADTESRKFYTEVILDEANKMDKLVKRLLELMKLEYEDRKFNDEKFDLVELINSVVKNVWKTYINNLYWRVINSTIGAFSTFNKRNRNKKQMEKVRGRLEIIC